MRAAIWLSLLAGSLSFGQPHLVTIAGLGPSHRAEIDGRPALSAPLGDVYGLLLDRSTGRLLLHDEILVERLEPDGTLLALAGSINRNNGSAADGAPASGARFGILRGMAEDSAGNLYLSDASLGRIFRVAPDGILTTFAGGGAQTGDGVQATAAVLSSPRGLVFDSHGNLNIAERDCRCIHRIAPDGTISTVYTLPPANRLRYFEGLAIDSHDNLYVTEYAGDAVLKIAPDGSPAILLDSSQVSGPSGVAVAPDGTLFVADTLHHRVLKLAPDGALQTIAGTGEAGFSGDGGPASAAQLNKPAQLLLAPDGSLYVSDYLNRRVRRISPAGVITTIAGSGDPSAFTANRNGDGGPAIYSNISGASFVLFDRAGNLLVSEVIGNAIRSIAPDGTIRTFAGTGLNFPQSDHSIIPGPYGLAFDTLGALFIADSDSRVRRIDPLGTISVYAGRGTGTGLVRSQGDGGYAIDATLNEPKGVAADAAGNLYIADTSNARLRVVDTRGIIKTVAGPGEQGKDYWNAVVLDSQGAVYIARTHAEAGNTWSVVDRVNADGSLARVAGSGSPCTFPLAPYPTATQRATDAQLCTVVGLTFANGDLYIPESAYGVVLRMTPDGLLSPVVDLHGFPNLASYFSPGSVAPDAAGNLFIAAGSRILESTTTPLVPRVAPDRIDFPAPVSRVLTVATNFAEPYPYLVRIHSESGPVWLTANRSSGVTGESLTLTPAATLAPGAYRATVTIQIAAPTPFTIDVPVTLTVP